MPYLLDTDVLRYYLDEVPSALSLVNDLVPDGIALSIVSYMELFQGTLQSPDVESAQARLVSLLTTIPILPFSPAVARRCAHLREDLKQQGKRVRQRALDLIIAATAMEYTLTLITRNRDDFRDIQSLEVSFYVDS